MVYAPKAPGSYDSGFIPKGRMIAQQMLGRELLPGEFVTFRDGDRTNFSHDNIVVLKTRADVRRFTSSNRDLGLVKLADGSYTYDPSVWKESKHTSVSRRRRNVSKESIIAYFAKTIKPTMTSAAAHFNVTVTCIDNILKRNKLNVSNYVGSEDERNTIISRLNKGEPLTKLSRSLGMTMTQLTARLKWYGIIVGDGTVTTLPSVRVPAELFARAAGAMPISEIADELGTYNAAVARCGELYGIKVRTRDGRHRKRVFTVDEVTEISEYVKANGINAAIAYFGTIDERFSAWCIRRIAENVDEFTRNNAVTPADRRAIADELNRYRERPNTVVRPATEQPRLHLVAATKQLEDTIVKQPAYEQPTIDEAVGRRNLAKRDLRQLLNAGFDADRISRLTGVTVGDLATLVKRYRLDGQYEHVLASVKAVLTECNVAELKAAGRTWRDVAEFYQRPASVVRLVMMSK